MIRSTLAATLILALAACSSPSTDTAPPTTAAPAPAEETASVNALLSASTLPMQAPPFDMIKDTDYQPAIEEGMRLHLAEIEKIANAGDAPTFENTFVALERSGEVLDRSARIFFALAQANTNDTLQAAQVALAPKLAEHSDAIYLNAELFKRVKAIYDVRESSGLGLKPVSPECTKRLMRSALTYAVKNGRKIVTIVHKGNIMKYTEGAFRTWAYEVVRDEFADVAVAWDDCGGKPGDKILVKDAIADAFLQQILLRPAEYDVIATLNLNGDYVSDALAAQVGGIGIAPGANINYATGHAIFEATHGTAPKYAGKDMVNPGSVILSGEMMLRYMGWGKAADLVLKGLQEAIDRKTVTYDFHRLMEGAEKVSTSAFGRAIIDGM